MIDDVSLFFTVNDSLPSERPTPAKSEIFCNSQEQDKFLPDNGVESSLLMDLDPGKTLNSCKRFFTAPSSNGLFIQLIRKDSGNGTSKFLNTSSENINKTSEYCPISIVSVDLDTALICFSSQSPARVSHLHFVPEVVWNDYNLDSMSAVHSTAAQLFSSSLSKTTKLFFLLLLSVQSCKSFIS